MTKKYKCKIIRYGDVLQKLLSKKEPTDEEIYMINKLWQWDDVEEELDYGYKEGYEV